MGDSLNARLTKLMIEERAIDALNALDIAERLVSALADVVDLYLHHEGWCCQRDLSRPESERRPCSCGYADALKRIEDEINK